MRAAGCGLLSATPTPSVKSILKPNSRIALSSWKIRIRTVYSISGRCFGMELANSQALRSGSVVCGLLALLRSCLYQTQTVTIFPTENRSPFWTDLKTTRYATTLSTDSGGDLMDGYTVATASSAPDPWWANPELLRPNELPSNAAFGVITPHARSLKWSATEQRTRGGMTGMITASSFS